MFYGIFDHSRHIIFPWNLSPHFSLLESLICGVGEMLYSSSMMHQLLRRYPHCQMLREQTFGSDPKRRVRGRITVSSMNSARIVLRFKCNYMNMKMDIEQFPKDIKTICNLRSMKVSNLVLKCCCIITLDTASQYVSKQSPMLFLSSACVLR